jgi:hypothetical protein
LAGAGGTGDAAVPVSERRQEAQFGLADIAMISGSLICSPSTLGGV